MAMRCLRILSIPIPILGILVLGAAVPLTWSQAAPSPDAPPVSTVPTDDTADAGPPRETLHVTSNLVSEYFTVRDKHNALVPYLTKSDCTVWENKQQQKLTSFVAEAKQPLTIGILVDTSGSQQYVLPLEQQAATSFLKRILRPADEAFVVSFDVGVNLEQDYTNNTRELERAINKVQINTAAGGGSVGVPGIGQGPIPTQGAPKGTLLYDAVSTVSNDKLRSETGRKAMILLTDGEDEGSLTKPKAAIAAAENANAIVYVILIADRAQYFGYGMGYTGDLEMRNLTEPTGGRVINVGNNGKKLEDAFDQIEQELRTQYVAQYTPVNHDMNGAFRKVDVFCKDPAEGLKVQARKGYFAVGGQDDDQ
ncbi:MAG TPA: VWA domain-containing protein [Acidobacteriaceae bacterium]|jgi:VWFA-related protein|nr:VWA domain-containing protein [Acidobacteriaceae bacterium]